MPTEVLGNSWGVLKLLPRILSTDNHSLVGQSKTLPLNPQVGNALKDEGFSKRNGLPMERGRTNMAEKEQKPTVEANRGKIIEKYVFINEAEILSQCMEIICRRSQRNMCQRPSSAVGHEGSARRLGTGTGVLVFRNDGAGSWILRNYEKVSLTSISDTISGIHKQMACEQLKSTGLGKTNDCSFLVS